MLIALDYDETYTKDPDFWMDFINLVDDHDHEIIIVTKRPADNPVDPELDILCIYYTNFEQKSSYMANLGIYPDIWIDDKPESIPFTPKS